MTKKKTFAQLEEELAKVKAKLAKLKKKAVKNTGDVLYIRFTGNIEIEIEIDKATLVANRWNSLDEDSRARLLYKLVRDEFAAKVRDESTRDHFMGSVRCETANNEDGEPLDFDEISKKTLDGLEEIGALDD